MSMHLDDFRNEVEYNLTFGPLADLDLPVVNEDGDSIVIVALANERLSDLFRRVDAAGGHANLFVRDDGIVHLVTILPSSEALLSEWAEDMTGGDDRPSLSSSVGMFVSYLRTCEEGVRLPSQMGASARLDRDVDLLPAM